MSLDKYAIGNVGIHPDIALSVILAQSCMLIRSATCVLWRLFPRSVVAVVDLEHSPLSCFQMRTVLRVLTVPLYFHLSIAAAPLWPVHIEICAVCLPFPCKSVRL